MKYLYKFLFVSIIIIFLNSILFPQDTLEIRLKEVIVSATRSETLLSNTPDVIRVISSTDIKSLQPSSVQEVLNHISGLNIEGGTGSGLPKRSIVHMNGFPAQYNLVLVDGVRLFSDHIHTGQNIEQIPVNNIERIEIISGASSAQYGSDALGGIINIITKECYSNTELAVNFGRGSYNSYTGGLSLQTPIKQKIKNSLYLSYEDSKGVELIAPVHRIGKMGYNIFSIMDKLNAPLSHEVDLFANLNLTYNNNQSGLRYYYSYLLMPTLGVKSRLTKDLNFTSRVSYVKWKSEQNLELNELWNPEIVMTYRGLSKNLIHIGIDFKKNVFTRTAVQKHAQHTYSGFVQDEYSYLHNLNFLAAVRFDKVENLNTVISPKFSMLYKPFYKYSIRASIGRGFHAPTVQELYEKGYGHGGAALRFGNEELKPEYSTTLNINNEYNITRSFVLMLNLFYSKIQDMIVPVYKGVWLENETKDVWLRENIHKASIYGADLTTKLNIFRSYNLELCYSLNANKNETFNLQLPYNPGKSISAKMTFYEPVSNSVLINGFVTFKTVDGRSAWNWKPAADSDPTNPRGSITALKNYRKVDAGITLNLFSSYSFYINLFNLLGEQIEMLDDAYTIYKGEPTYSAGLSCKF